MSAISRTMTEPSNCRKPTWTALLRAWRAARQSRRQRRATIDLVNSSPYLLRDIGLTEERITCRRP